MEIKNYERVVFENIRHLDDDGNEFWYARELKEVLEYKEWRNFEKIIKRSILSASNSTFNNFSWVVEVNKPIKTGKGKSENIKDYKLSRYACYLIVQNSDPRKKVVALGQTYFTVQTRKQELIEIEYEMLNETDKRFYQRNIIKKGNYSLNKIAVDKGVNNMANFHNAGV